MPKYRLVIDIDAPDAGSADDARDEIAGAIEDARDSDELGGCDVDVGDLEPVT